MTLGTSFSVTKSQLQPASVGRVQCVHLDSYGSGIYTALVYRHFSKLELATWGLAVPPALDQQVSHSPGRQQRHVARLCGELPLWQSDGCWAWGGGPARAVVVGKTLYHES